MIKLIVKEKKVKIDRKNRRVICDLTAKAECPYNLSGRIVYNHKTIDVNNFTVRGIAICSNSDIFDDNIGKQVSINKARLEAYRVLKLIIESSKKSIDRKLKEIDQSEQRLEKFISREKSRLKELSFNNN